MRTISMLPLLLAPALAFAQSNEDQVSYRYLALGLTDVSYDVPGPNVKGSGLGLEYSTDAREHVHLFAAYDVFDLKDVGNDANGDRRAFGVGTQFSLTDRLSVYGRFGYLDTDVDLGNGNVDDSGGLVVGGLRYALGKGWEVRGSAEYVSLDKAGSDSYFTIGGDMFMTDAVALSLDAADRDGSRTIMLGVRFYFDKQAQRGDGLGNESGAGMGRRHRR